MRTMLISLILICSLAQLACAGLAPITPEDCGTIYNCFAPEICKPALNLPISEFKNKGVAQVGIGDEITGDCPALIRLYQEGKFKLYVNLKSYSTTHDRIEFWHTNQHGMVSNLFSCERDASGIQISKHGDKVIENSDSDPQDGKLDCQFSPIAKKKIGDSILAGKSSDKIRFKIRETGVATPVETKMLSTSIDSERCNPKTLNMNLDSTPENHYKKLVTHGPLKYGCDKPDLYTIEFRTGESGTFNKVTSIDCATNGDVWIINGAEMLEPKAPHHPIKFEIRCAAETKFMCSNDVKRKLDPNEPKFNEDSVAGKSMKCPPEKPLLAIVEGAETYIKKPKFECLLFGSIPSWFVSEEGEAEGKKRRLTQKGPEIFCTNTQKCQGTISEKIVDGGTLDRNTLPKCFARGVLKTVDNKEAVPRCDDSDGKYKYSAGGVDHIIDENTKLVCEYPVDESAAKAVDKQHENAIYTGAIVTTVCCVIAGIVIAGLTVFCIRRKMKMLNARYKAQYAAQTADDAKYFTKGERKAAKKKALDKKKSDPPSEKKPEKTEKVEQEKWNVAVISLQYMSLTNVSPLDGPITVKELETDNDVVNWKKGEQTMNAYELPMDEGTEVFKETEFFKGLMKRDEEMVNMQREDLANMRSGKPPVERKKKNDDSEQ